MIRANRLVVAGACVVLVLCRSLPAQTQPADDSARIQKLVDTLNADDPADRARAEGDIDSLPYWDLPLLEKVAGQEHSPEVQMRLTREVTAMRRRADRAAKARVADVPEWEWIKKAALDSYVRGSHHDPKWDDAAKEGIKQAWNRGVVLDLMEREKESVEGRRQLRAALDAGCDDPVVLISAGLIESDLGQPADKVLQYFVRASEHMDDPTLDPYFHVVVSTRLARAYTTGYNGGVMANRQKVFESMNEMARNIRTLETTPGVPLILLVGACTRAMEVVAAEKGPPSIMFRIVYPQLERLAPNDEQVLRFKGVSHIDMAWEARGSGWANTVTPQGLKDFLDRLAIANDALTAAWQMDPTDPVPPTRMLTVELGQGKGRDVLELWFKRAMEADPDNYEACWRKEMYLEPKWYGSPDEMVKFGHECLDGGNFHTDIPYELINIHTELANMSTDKAGYLKQDSVWSDMDAVYSGYLNRYPDRNVLRTRYTIAACNAGRWDVANEQFKKLGDKVDVKLFGSENIMERFRNKAREEAAAK